MGDIRTLLERFEELSNKEAAEEAAKHLLGGRFSLRDMRTQLESLGQMGPVSKIVSMFPGFGGSKMDDKALDATQVRLRRFRAILDSMTPEELDDAQLIKAERVHRISRGSGQRPQEVRALLKQYETTRRAAHGLVSNRRLRRQLEKQFAGNAPTGPE
jgi:signal recognition particle subunit SRP54